MPNAGRPSKNSRLNADGNWPVGGSRGNPVSMLSELLAEITTGIEQSSASLAALYSLLDRVPVATLGADNKARYVYANDAASILLGYDTAELLKLSVGAVTPNVMEGDAERLWAAFVAIHEQTGVYQLLTKDSQVVAAEYAARANVLPGLHLTIMRPIAPRTRTRSDPPVAPSTA